MQRIDASDKAFGKVKYTNVVTITEILHAKSHTSYQAHALIKSIDTSEAWNVTGVPQADDKVIDQSLDSNLCRCTRYQEIIEAVKDTLNTAVQNG